jgi:hypothetical protein
VLSKKRELSYESKVFKELSLPNRDEVIHVLLTSFFKHNGRVKEFGAGNQEFVDELADSLQLSHGQRSFLMQTVVRKEGRIKTFPAWHRLLFRAADSAAKEKLLTHPKDTLKLTGKREWMLTEKGIDAALRLLRIPIAEKQDLAVVTVEVEKIGESIVNAERIKDYNPIDVHKKTKVTKKESLLRTRGFRHAVIEAYNYTCCVCGLKIASPDSLSWEVEAAHIVPHRFHGRDDIWNAIAFCRFHHWLFDVGWFTLRNDFTVEVNDRIQEIPADRGFMGNFDVMRKLLIPNRPIRLPNKNSIYPHENSILWHRNNIFIHLK